jgi:hypothetical protein
VRERGECVPSAILLPLFFCQIYAAAFLLLPSAMQAAKPRRTGFMPERALYKASKSGDKLVHWTGYITDRTINEAVWHAGPSTFYGDALVGAEAGCFTKAHLAWDLAAGQRLVSALREQLASDNALPHDSGVDGSHGTGGSDELKKALAVVKNCKKNPPAWKVWLSTAVLKASTAALKAVPRVRVPKPKLCGRCRMDGCKGVPFFFASSCWF